jgi:ABC-2 type transport system permease protein
VSIREDSWIKGTVMKKLLNVALKDLTVAFRDPSALIWMLATPFLLTLAMAFAFGRLTGGTSQSSGLSDIPVVIVNHDAGQFSQFVVQAFESKDLSELLEPSKVGDEAAARKMVDDDKAAAAVIIPADFSDSILPPGLQAGAATALSSRQQAVVEVYGNQARPISVGVIRSLVARMIDRLGAGQAGAQVAIMQLLAGGLVSPQELQTVGQDIGARAGQAASTQALIGVKSQTIESQASSGGFDWLGYMAPSMAIMFLMFTAMNGARTILSERQWGTLPRMLASPSTPTQILGGKVAGIFLIGAAQLFILILASSLAFGVKWGSPIAVVALTLAVVAAATGWGIVLAAYAKSPGQVGSVGSMLALVFAGLAGNFVPRQNYPQWLQTAGYVTPNAWGLEGFTKLTSGGTLSDVALPIVALGVMAAVLFTIATLAFRRQYK